MDTDGSGYEWVMEFWDQINEHSATIMRWEFMLRWATIKFSRRCLFQATNLQFSICVLRHACWLGKSPEGESDNSILVCTSVLYYGPSHITWWREFPTGTPFFTYQLSQRLGSVTSKTRGRNFNICWILYVYSLILKSNCCVVGLRGTL